MKIFISMALMIATLANCNSKKSIETHQSAKQDISSNDTSVQSPTYVINKFGSEIPKVVKSEEQWKKELTDQEYYVLRQEGTERSFTSPLNDNKQEGLYACSGCGTVLFTSKTKFDSGTGWPSFYRPDDPAYIAEHTDYKIGYARTEVECAICGGHLGHVFDDGPQPTGLRYCINGVSLKFIKAEN